MARSKYNNLPPKEERIQYTLLLSQQMDADLGNVLNKIGWEGSTLDYIRYILAAWLKEDRLL